jgi:hypothetical protein
MAYLAALFAPPVNGYIFIHESEPEAVTVRVSHSPNQACPPATQSTVFSARHKQCTLLHDGEEAVADMPRQRIGQIKCKKL